MSTNNFHNFFFFLFNGIYAFLDYLMAYMPSWIIQWYICLPGLFNGIYAFLDYLMAYMPSWIIQWYICLPGLFNGIYAFLDYSMVYMPSDMQDIAGEAEMNS